MAARSFLPDKDGALLQWANAFSTQITATPTAFGLVTAQAVSFATVFSTYQSALNAATNDSTRTKGSIAAKNTARQTLRINAGNLARIIYGTPTVTDQQKENLGLTVKSPPSPKPTPDAPPALQIVSVIGRTVTIRLKNAEIASKRARPAGTNGAAVFSHVGATPPTSVSGWTFQGNTGKTLNTIVFDPSLAPGSTVFLTAFWVGSRMESGPAADPISLTFGAAGVSQAA